MMKTPMATRERSLDNPSQWSGLFTFTAYVQAIKVEVHLVYGNALMVWLPYKDAYALDLPTVFCLGTTPKECLQFVRRSVASGTTKDWLMRYFTNLDADLYWAEVAAANAKRAAKYEADQEEDRQWMASPQFQRQQLQRLLMDFGPDKAWQVTDFFKMVYMVIQHNPQAEDEVRQVMQQHYFEDVSERGIKEILDGCKITDSIIREVLTVIHSI